LLENSQPQCLSVLYSVCSSICKRHYFWNL